MSFTYRQAKTSLSKRTLLTKVLDALGFRALPQLLCPISRTKSHVNVSQCVNFCHRQCNLFLEFQFVTGRCDDVNCAIDNPCPVCLDEIDRLKVLYRALKAVNNDEAERPKKINRQLKQYLRIRNRSNDD